jgi:hypothetical protein
VQHHSDNNIDFVPDADFEVILPSGGACVFRVVGRVVSCAWPVCYDLHTRALLCRQSPTSHQPQSLPTVAHMAAGSALSLLLFFARGALLERVCVVSALTTTRRLLSRLRQAAANEHVQWIRAVEGL